MKRDPYVLVHPSEGDAPAKARTVSPIGNSFFGRAHAEAAVEKSLDGLRYDPTQRTEGPLEPVFVFPGEAVEELVKDCVEGGPLGPPKAVEFRFIRSKWSAADFIHDGVAWSRPNYCRISGQGDRNAEFCTRMQGALAVAEGMESEHS